MQAFGTKAKGSVMLRAALLALTLAPLGLPGAQAFAARATGLPAIAANASPQLEEAASRRCWRQKGKRVCEKVENGTPSASEPYFDFAPNAVPTARRGWKLDDPVNHPVPSPN
jgi:hypothetical protein